MKIENNQIVEDLFGKGEEAGQLTAKESAKKIGIVRETDVVRSQLEQLHPELRGANWRGGAVIELQKSVQQNLNEKARGEHGPRLVFRARGGGAPSISIYDLLGFRPFRAKLGIVLGRIGRTITGESIKQLGIRTPYQVRPRQLPRTGGPSSYGMPPPGGGGGPVPIPPHEPPITTGEKAAR